MTTRLASNLLRWYYRRAPLCLALTPWVDKLHMCTASPKIRVRRSSYNKIRLGRSRGRNGCSGTCLRTICTARSSHSRRFPEPSRNRSDTARRSARTRSLGLLQPGVDGGVRPETEVPPRAFPDPDTTAAEDRRQPCGGTPSVPRQPLGRHARHSVSSESNRRKSAALTSGPFKSRRG